MTTENTTPTPAPTVVAPTAPDAPQAAPSPVVAAPVAAPVEELIDIDLFAKVKFRVGRVEAAEAVPKSKKLLKLQVNLGPTLGTRQILSGISQFYTPESLIGKQVVIVANLKPAKMMGLDSQGMLLAAATDDNSALTIIQPTVEIAEGSTVR